MLNNNFIDLGKGDARIIRNNLFKNFNVHQSDISNYDLSYQFSPGYVNLVKYLEDRYQSKIIICNGAKQGLCATLYALSRLNYSKLGVRYPTWELIPPLAEIFGLEISNKYDCYLSIYPNNPDGFSYSSYEYAQYLFQYLNFLKIPVIHDAVYFNEIYLGSKYKFGKLGDCQIYSISKMFGLSSLRIGFVAVHNSDYYNLIKEYIDTTTVGVNIFSQSITLDLFKEIDTHKDNYNSFVTGCREDLLQNKALLSLLKNDVLEVPPNIESSIGMFAWLKKGAKFNPKKSKVIVCNGKCFGDDSMVRLNLGVESNVLKEGIDRLNNI